MFRRKQSTDLLSTNKKETPTSGQKSSPAHRRPSSAKPSSPRSSSPRSRPSSTIKHEPETLKGTDVLDRFDKLASRHEDLLSKHEVLFQQHQSLLVKHEHILSLFETHLHKTNHHEQHETYGQNHGHLVTSRCNSSPTKPPIPLAPKRHSPTQTHRKSNPEVKVQEHRRSVSRSPARSSHRKSTNHASGTINGLRVCVRKRPAKPNETDCVECIGHQILLHEDKVKVDLTKYESVTKFNLDGVFGENHATTDVYDESVRYLIDNFFAGGTSTCFCFGQTASGKTFTLFGEGGGTHQQHEGSSLDASADSGGIYMLAASSAFDRLRLLQEREGMGQVVLQLSMFEIYGQKVRDLLADCKELAALEDGNGVLQLVGLEAHICEDIADFVRVSNEGRASRATNATGANATSSRSHGALLLRLVNTATSEVLGKFSLIDLAGSERGADNDTTDKQTQIEGRQINQSLLALKEVIRAKELGRSHAPFRQSRLTQVLEESLTGARCYTTVIGCVSPNIKDTQQTLNTLRYAESLSPNTGKHPSKTPEDDFVSLGAPILPTNASASPNIRMSKKKSMLLMSAELGDDEDDGMSLL
mmetsp:Transcript_10874/g.14149  ORF Transcript_10874/g.14149 Transcript_10874/m.14149 type:complete len:588 (-) Transcript_10874:103-1866(-)